MAVGKETQRGKRERGKREEEGRIQGYLFASDIKLHTGVCLGDVP